MEVSRSAEVSQGRISTRRIRICGQKLKILSVRAEKLDPKIPSLLVLVVLVVLVVVLVVLAVVFLAPVAVVAI